MLNRLLHKLMRLLLIFLLFLATHLHFFTFLSIFKPHTTLSFILFFLFYIYFGNFHHSDILVSEVFILQNRKFITAAERKKNKNLNVKTATNQISNRHASNSQEQQNWNKMPIQDITRNFIFLPCIADRSFSFSHSREFFDGFALKSFQFYSLSLSQLLFESSFLVFIFAGFSQVLSYAASLWKLSAFCISCLCENSFVSQNVYCWGNGIKFSRVEGFWFDSR